MLKHIIHDFYYLSLLVIAVSIPLSPFLLTVGMIMILFSWVISGGWTSKWQRFIGQRDFMAFLMIYLVHGLWLLNTQNMSWAGHDLRIKLPLLICPLVIGTMPKISRQQLKYLLCFFLLAVFVNTVISTWVYFQKNNIPHFDPRDISIFISHIRFSLCVVFAVAISIYLSVDTPNKIERIIYWSIAGWMIIFLFVLQSITGIVLLFLILPLVFLWLSRQYKMLKPLRLMLLAAALVCLIGIIYLAFQVQKFHQIQDENITIQEKTVNGYRYRNDLTKGHLENGFRVWIHVCEQELEKSWNVNSQMNYLDRDKNGNRIQTTLLRYLTSKGLKKDSVGFSQLTKQDIVNIENGIPNYKFAEQSRFQNRIYQLIWEIHNYNLGENPSGHSLTQRMEYLKIGWAIFESNVFFGTGTGDVPDAFRHQYEESASVLKERWRLRTHNQYLTFLLTFGLIGFIMVSFAFCYPVFKRWRLLSMLGKVFLLISAVSMLNEDTLETHIGVSFVAFFAAIFLFGIHYQGDTFNFVATIAKIRQHVSKYRGYSQ